MVKKTKKLIKNKRINLKEETKENLNDFIKNKSICVEQIDNSSCMFDQSDSFPQREESSKGRVNRK